MLDVHCCIEREHDTKAGPRVVRRNADDLRAVAADNGFQDWYTEYEIAALNIDYLVHYRGSSLMATANNALIRAKGYTQRWMAESPTRRSSERRTPPCVRGSGTDSSVKSFSYSLSITSRNSPKRYDPTAVPHFQ